MAEYKGKGFIPEYEATKKSIGEKWASIYKNCDFLSLYSDDYREELNKHK